MLLLRWQIDALKQQSGMPQKEQSQQLQQPWQLP
jgi:hypothetical protein